MGRIRDIQSVRKGLNEGKMKDALEKVCSRVSLRNSPRDLARRFPFESSTIRRRNARSTFIVSLINIGRR